MNILDSTVIDCINLVSQKSEVFNVFIYHLSRNELFKGAALSAAIWWLWFKPDEWQKEHRITLISTLIASLISVGITRVLATSLPFRPRPLINESINFIAPYLDARWRVDTMSSFPSDHATLSICLAFGLYCASKRLGRIMLAYSLVFILLPRVYLGLHYLSDIIVGGFVGAVVVFWTNKSWFADAVSSKVYAYSVSNPQTFYFAMFIFTYETSDLYIHIRNVVRFAINAIS